MPVLEDPVAREIKQADLDMLDLAAAVGEIDLWLILTDLQPEVADACWYGMRYW